MSRSTLVAWTLGLMGGFGATGCADEIEVTGEPITIGLLAPGDGNQLSETGAMMRAVATAAADNINRRGGVGGRPLVLVVEDIGDTADGLDAAYDAVRAAGAVAVVGPVTPDQVQPVLMRAAADEVPVVSPVAQTPWGARRTADPDTFSYHFRTVASGDLEALVISYLIRTRYTELYPQLVAQQPLDLAYTVAEGDCSAVTPTCSVAEGDVPSDIGAGVFTYFGCLFALPDVRARTASDNLLFSRGAADTIANSLTSLDPTPRLAVVAGLDADARTLIEDWEDGQQLLGLNWFFTASARTPTFLTQLSPEAAGALCYVDRDEYPAGGAAPVPPLLGGSRRYLELTVDGAVSERPFASNTWDAVHVTALALAAQELRGASPGGAALRDELRAISEGGVVLHAGQWTDALSVLAGGGDVDYDGASGPLDFDTDGELISPFETWQIACDETGTPSFRTDQYIDPRVLGDVLATFTPAIPGDAPEAVRTELAALRAALTSLDDLYAYLRRVVELQAEAPELDYGFAAFPATCPAEVTGE